MTFIYIQFVVSEMSCISLSLLKILCLILDPIHFFNWYTWMGMKWGLVWRWMEPLTKADSAPPKESLTLRKAQWSGGWVRFIFPDEIKISWACNPLNNEWAFYYHCVTQPLLQNLGWTMSASIEITTKQTSYVANFILLKGKKFHWKSI